MSHPIPKEKNDTDVQDQDRQATTTPSLSLQPHGYWSESRRPLASLLFILPFLIVYEVGILCLGPAAVRNGVDIWLRQLFDWMGFGQYFLLPLLTIGILLCWQYTSRQPWHVSRGVLGGMFAESLLLACCLRFVLYLQAIFSQTFAAQAEQLYIAATTASKTTMAIMSAGANVETLNLSATFSNLVMFLGAGIYEELLFRLIFLTAAIWLLRHLGMKRMLSIVAAIILTSTLFSVAHYVGSQGETPQLFSFTFRFIAGVFFCVLFVYRGFGIAAGTHAAYDIIVGLF